MIRRILTLLFAAVLLVPAYATEGTMLSEEDDRARIRSGKPMHFTDTLDTAKEIRQFEQALDVAPQAFVCRKCTQSPGLVVFETLRMNPTIDNVLQTPLVTSDPSLVRKFKRIGRLTHLFFGACDLRVSYWYLPNGHISVAYDISRIRFFVFR